jgi:hypothetical protein
MNLVRTPSPVRYLGVAIAAVLVMGIGAGIASADPASRTHNYFAQVAAGTRPDNRAGIRGVNAPAFATVSARQTSSAVRPDDRAGIRGVGAPVLVAAPVQLRKTAVRPDDRAGNRGIGTSAVIASGVSVGTSSTFDWADAGVGAGSALALVLIAGGLLELRGRLRVPASHA